MIKKLDISDRRIAKEILNVQIPSYSVEAEIIGYDGIPPLKDTVESLQQCGETFYGYFAGDDLCGAISIKAENGVIDIHRLVVHPKHFRKGIAQSLLYFIEGLHGFDTITVSTASINTPAINFYKKNGFFKFTDVRVNEQLSLSYFKKRVKS